jgi:hypothetical protein
VLSRAGRSALKFTSDESTLTIPTLSKKQQQRGQQQPSHGTYLAAFIPVAQYFKATDARIACLCNDQ